MLFRSWHTYSMKFKIFSSANKQKYNSLETVTSECSDSFSKSSRNSSINLSIHENMSPKKRKSRQSIFLFEQKAILNRRKGNFIELMFFFLKHIRCVKIFFFAYLIIINMNFY